jgi:Fur family zinc uptake transcriptional regulator
MDDIDNFIKQAETNCHQLGSRLTTKRKMVLTALLHVKKAISAYELITLVDVKFNESLAPMSVYRILDFLEKNHLIHKLNIANKYVACADITSEQHHEASQLLFCQKCQRVDEIKLNSTKLIELDNEAKQSGYQLLSSHIELNCICNTCLP